MNVHVNEQVFRCLMCCHHGDLPDSNVFAYTTYNSFRSYLPILDSRNAEFPQSYSTHFRGYQINDYIV